MARRTTNTNNYWEQYKHYIVPSLIGGVIAWLFSGSFVLGLEVFVAVWVGTWIGHTMLGKK